MMRLDEPLPEAVEVEGIFYNIHTDFKFWIKLDTLIKSKKATPQDFYFMYTDKAPDNIEVGVQSLIAWMNPPRTLPRPAPGDGGPGVKCIDYELDAPLIYSAFMQVYHIDLIDARLHWYKFLALLEGLKDTKLTDVIGFRLYDSKGDTSDYSKQQEKLRDAWAIESNEEKQENDEALKDFIEYINEE